MHLLWTTEDRVEETNAKVRGEGKGERKKTYLYSFSSFFSSHLHIFLLRFALSSAKLTLFIPIPPSQMPRFAVFHSQKTHFDWFCFFFRGLPMAKHAVNQFLGDRIRKCFSFFSDMI